MARRDALLKLHKGLMARRNALRKALAGELEDLRGSQLIGDVADIAFDAGSDEITSQLAQLEARELFLVERALARIKHGSYGVCEGCAKKIPVARLNALPYSGTCVECQKEMELHPNWGGNDGDWGKVSDTEGLDDRRRVDLSDLEMDVSGNSR